MTPAAFTAALADHNLTQTNFARLTGLTNGTVSRWVRGVRPVPVWAERLLDAMRDAARLRHITAHAEHMPDPEPYPGPPIRWGWSVQWGAWGDRETTLIEAIDRDMARQAPKQGETK